MIAKGRVVNGVVVFDQGTSLPEGTVVSIVPARPTPSVTDPRDVMSEEQKERLQAALARIDALPNENPGDTFSGSDHDQELYGVP